MDRPIFAAVALAFLLVSYGPLLLSDAKAGPLVIAQANESPSQDSAPPGEALPAPSSEVAPVPTVSRERPSGLPAAAARPSPRRAPLSLNFDDADVYQVVQTVFGDVLKVNYVVDARVKGRVTFRSVAPIAYDQILPVMEVILRVNGIGVVEDAGLYRIVPIGDVSREPAPISVGRDPDKIVPSGKSVVQIIPIVTLQSSEVVKLITPFLSANAVIVDIPKSNQIIVVDTDASLKRLLRLVNALDSDEQKRRHIQVFVYPIQNGKAKNVAALLQQIFLGARPPQAASSPTVTGGQSQPGAQQPAPAPVQTTAIRTMTAGGDSLVSDMTKIYADETANTIIALATPEDYEIIKETLQKVDAVPRQVMIEGVIAQVNLTDNLSLGLSASFKTSFNVNGSPIRGTLGLNPGSLSEDKLPASGFTFVGRSDGDIRAVVSALASKSKAKLLAAPHVLVADNREARIQVGEQVPIVTSETYGSTTVSPQRTIQYKDTGIILKVTPQVNESGLVALTISQEVSTYSTIQLFSNETNIVLHKTEASTNLVVQDGETIMIGGLIREDTSKSRSGVPLLSRIPLLGYLFGNTTDDDTRTEIIILLTPHVIRDPGETKAVTEGFIQKFMTGKGGMQRKEITGGDSRTK